MYRINFGKATITVDSESEMQKVMDYIGKLEDERSKLVLPDAGLARVLAGLPDVNPWTHKTFSEFTGSIGPAQLTALSLLVKHEKVSDADLRKAVGVETNQQLAGVLSGLSKQAAAHNLPAREVFTIQNESKSGVTTKHYVIARHLLEIARANNWPLD